MDRPHTLVQYQYVHGTLLVLAFKNGTSTGIGIIHWFSTSMGTVHYRYWHSNIVPLLVLAFYFGPVPVLARSITGTGIKWCQYRYWHVCILVKYQYLHGTLPVLAFNGARTGNGIYAFWSTTSIGTVHYRYWH